MFACRCGVESVHQPSFHPNICRSRRNKMRLNMHVVYDGKELVYDMPVGDGRMTIKWLGE